MLTRNKGGLMLIGSYETRLEIQNLNADLDAYEGNIWRLAFTYHLVLNFYGLFIYRNKTSLICNCLII